jgi:ABC-type transport system involved in multi-copper enzyme maturation permease subunit
VREIPTAVIEKDLRLRMRGWRWAGVTSLYVGILAVIAIAFLLHRYSLTASESSRAGIDLFQSLSFGQLFLILFVTPASVAGAISGERQHRTWDLLVMSPLSAASIIWGKLLAGLAFNLVLIAASLPLFGLVFLFGGITPAAMFPTFLVFLATVLLLGAASLLVSALTARLTVSYMISMLVALLLAVGLTLLTLYIEALGQLSLVTLGSLPYESISSASPLPPLAQLDPLVALLSALPAETGGTLLGDLGTIDHAFGLPVQLPLWGAYVLLSLIISLILTLGTTRLVRPSPALRLRDAARPWQTVGGRQ